MAIIHQTVYNSRLCEPFSITVECGGKKKEFRWEERAKAGDWVTDQWKQQEDGFFNTHSPAFIYYNIDWDEEHILYAKYELEGVCEA